MLQILLVEDEKEGIESCCQAIWDIVADCNIIVTRSAEEAFVKMTEDQVDAFFLDVMLPGMDGFKFAECVRSYDEYALTPIIFITARTANHSHIHRRYHHYEYIEKPYTLQSFRNSVGKLLMTLKRQKEKGTKGGDVRIRLIQIRNRDLVSFVNYENILYAETAGRSIIVHTRRESFKSFGYKLSEFISYVDETSFLRCHKSYAVNTGNISLIEDDGRYRWKVLFTDSDKTCDLGSTYYKQVMDYMDEMTRYKRQKSEV